MCIDLHQTGSIGEGSDHLSLIKFWPSRAPGKGVCGKAKILAPPYYSQRQCVRLRVLFSAFCAVHYGQFLERLISKITCNAFWGLLDSTHSRISQCQNFRIVDLLEQRMMEALTKTSHLHKQANTPVRSSLQTYQLPGLTTFLSLAQHQQSTRAINGQYCSC